ncbi:MAG TPA: hypothetical protein VNN62_04535 [Methylomirabilota bacterium]|jgi:hypothetical protein|nr:hypothetical protein [Methylomirabilota bacterium]
MNGNTVAKGFSPCLLDRFAKGKLIEQIQERRQFATTADNKL